MRRFLCLKAVNTRKPLRMFSSSSSSSGKEKGKKAKTYTSTRVVTDEPQYVVKYYFRQVLADNDDSAETRARGVKTVRMKQFGVYEKDRRKDGSYYMKYRIISGEEAHDAEHKGNRFHDKFSEPKKYPASYTSADTREGQILQKGVKIKSNKNAEISGKRSTLITERDIDYIASKYGVVPSKVTSIIQHVDGVIIEDLTEATARKPKGFTRK